MRRTSHVFGGLILLSVLSACALGPRVTEANPARSDILTAEDISLSGGSTAFDGIRLLRGGLPMEGFAPSFRDRRGAAPTIYLDGLRIRDHETLRSITVTDLMSMEYLDAPTATIRYGTDHVGGAIVVQTRKD